MGTSRCSKFVVLVFIVENFYYLQFPAFLPFNMQKSELKNRIFYLFTHFSYVENDFQYFPFSSSFLNNTF